MASSSDSTMGGRWALPFLGLACAVGVGSIYYNQPLLMVMGASLHTSAHAMGFVATATQVGYAIGLLCLVPLGDIAERRGLMMKLYAGVSVALLLAGLAPNLWSMVAASILIGLFAAVTHIALPIAPDLVPVEKRGQAIGTVMTGLLLGVLLARTFAGWLNAWHGWRTVYFAAAVMNLAFVPTLAKLMPRLEPKQSLSYAATLRSLGTIFRKEPLLREAGMMGALSFASFSCFWTTMAFMLASHYHMGPGVAGSFGIVGAAGAMVAPVAGRLSDKRGTRYVVTVAGAVFTFALVILWLGDKIHAATAVHLVVLVVGVLVLDMGQQMLQVANQTRIFGLGSEERSRLNTVYMTMYFIGGAVGSALSTMAWSRWEWDGVCVLQLALIGLAGLRHVTGYSRTQPHVQRHVPASEREFAEM
ncbi:MAG: MFS transporter [Acidobacteriaceae bacterium]|nr:MFS transporter [Acidobacteriaceae bacterium]